MLGFRGLIASWKVFEFIPDAGIYNYEEL